MSSREAGLDIVQREEENNAMDASAEADQHAASGNYDAANNAANESEEHAQNASSLKETLYQIINRGWAPIAYPSFVVGMINATNIFISTCGSSMFLPVISEMKRPHDYRKACLVAGFIVMVMYLSFSLTIYRWCRTCISTPAFGSAGPLIKKIAYGVSLPGLILGVGIYQHVAAKYAFVRILRDSEHLQTNTFTHWGTWLGINLALGTAAFIVAEAVPILNYLLGLAGSLCFAPFSLVFPALLWMYDFKSYKTGTLGQKIKYGLHILIMILGFYMIVAGTYSVAVLIKEAFNTGAIAKVFDCADNSGFVQ